MAHYFFVLFTGSSIEKPSRPSEDEMEVERAAMGAVREKFNELGGGEGSEKGSYPVVGAIIYLVEQKQATVRVVQMRTVEMTPKFDLTFADEVS